MLKIIEKLWSIIYDLLFYIDGRGKTLEQIQSDIDVAEMMCRPYADTDDVEVFAREEDPVNPRDRP